MSEKKYLEFIAEFLIILVLTLPFYTEQRNVLINEYTENASEVLIKLTISIQDLLKDLILKIGYNLEFDSLLP